jgi:urea transport system permease protein
MFSMAYAETSDAPEWPGLTRSFAAPLLALCLCIGFALLLARPAAAQSLDEALAHFRAGSYDETLAGVNALAESGAPRAAAIVQALADGNLYVSDDGHTIYIADADGKLTLAASGEAARSEVTVDDLDPVRVNNRIRNAVSAALGALTLQAPDPARRLAAAQAVFASRDPAALKDVEAALAHEADPEIRSALMQAHAAILIAKPDAAEADRLEAVRLIGARGNEAAQTLLRGLPAEAPPALRAAAQSEIASIEARLAFWGALQNAWYGLSLGSVLLLAAIGLAITFGVMGVINMAHGELVMLGAYTTFVVQQLVRAHAPWLLDFSLFIALPLAFLVSGAVGVIIERCVICFLYGRPLETLLATWGLALILQQAVRTIFGPTNRAVGTPGWMSGSFPLGGLTITDNRLAIVVFALAVFAALLVVLNRTSLGLQVRAVTQNRRMAGSMGIKTGRIDALTFGLGSGVAGIAGVALSQIDNVSPNLGQGYIIDSFMVVVFGGVGNLWGTLVGAMTLGIANKFLEPYAGAVLGKIILLVAIILFIQKRPRGLFALKGRAVEA